MSSKDGEVVITYNGEVYNYLGIKKFTYEKGDRIFLQTLILK